MSPMSSTELLLPPISYSSDCTKSLSTSAEKAKCTSTSSRPPPTSSTYTTTCKSKISNEFATSTGTLNSNQIRITKTNSYPNAMTIAVASITSTKLTSPPKKSANDFVFGKYIGDGSFSMVYLARDVHSKREYAIKVCDKRHIIREGKQENIRREREVMHIMSNVPGFVNLSCTFQDNRSLYFVMTYAKNGDLLPYINKVGSFDLECSRHYAAELVLACENMRLRGVVHRDLKPENILLDENMHILIADFGSAKILMEGQMSTVSPKITTKETPTSACNKKSYEKYVGAEKLDDEVNQRKNRQKRSGSFVGTAQYVSPEVLNNTPITPATDLWSLGCIMYQMISGLTPFRGSTDYTVFREILECNLEFPQGFDKDAEDLILKLLKLNPVDRLGAQDSARYESIRSHQFFANICFETIRDKKPPPIFTYLPEVNSDDNFRCQYKIPENLEPGLDNRQISRLLGLEMGVSLAASYVDKKSVFKNEFELSESEKKIRLEHQKFDIWHPFVGEEVILKKGFVNKRKGLFARKRMLLLTTGPRLIYIDPVQMIKKGEIPWSSELRVEPKNFKLFFVHTPQRTYYLEDTRGYALEWVDTIENLRKLTFKD